MSLPLVVAESLVKTGNLEDTANALAKPGVIVVGLLILTIALNGKISTAITKILIVVIALGVMGMGGAALGLGTTIGSWISAIFGG